MSERFTVQPDIKNKDRFIVVDRKNKRVATKGGRVLANLDRVDADAYAAGFNTLPAMATQSIAGADLDMPDADKFDPNRKNQAVPDPNAFHAKENPL